MAQNHNKTQSKLFQREIKNKTKNKVNFMNIDKKSGFVLFVLLYF